MDVTFFVKAHDFLSLMAAREKVVGDISKDGVLNFFVKDAIVLPATANAYELCRKYYPSRSAYPFETWRSPDDLSISPMKEMSRSLPLDQISEKLLFTYFLPVLRGKRTNHHRERGFLLRKIKQEADFLGLKPPLRDNGIFYGAFLSAIEMWDIFYQGMKFTDQKEKFSFWPGEEYDYQEFLSCWKAASGILKDHRVIASVWVYPDWRNEKAPYLAVNFKAGISERACEDAVKAVVDYLKELKCSLLFGTEASMLGRINGLAQLNLLEPWFFQRYGLCLHGDPGIKDKIVTPSVDMLKEKFRILMVLFSYAVMHRPQYSYGYYKICFVLDHLLRSGEICTDSRILAGIYGSEFIMPRDFSPGAHSSEFLRVLEKRQQFTLF